MRRIVAIPASQILNIAVPGPFLTSAQSATTGLLEKCMGRRDIYSGLGQNHDPKLVSCYGCFEVRVKSIGNPRLF